jgi:hypothetical protein
MISSICICLCVYQNAKGLPAIFRNIDIVKQSGLFREIVVIAYYDNSTDSSLQLLEQYRNRFPQTTIIHHNNDTPLSTRVQRISKARNGLLSIIRRYYAHFRFFAMMDSNDYSCVGNIRPVTIENMLRRESEWDAISFDRMDGYYDHWALSYSPFIYSFFHFADWGNAVYQLREDFSQKMEYWRKKTPNELIPVYSAFNGFAIYKTAIFIDCSYSSVIDHSMFPPGSIETHCEIIQQSIVKKLEDDCEHRYFHLSSIKKKGARIRISLEYAFERVVPTLLSVGSMKKRGLEFYPYNS